MRIITEEEFCHQLQVVLYHDHGKFAAVMGPGRSGAIASVYASHYLSIPWLPYKAKRPVSMNPLLIIDTAAASGATLRKLMSWADAAEARAVFVEPPRVKFWYEKIGGVL